MAFLSGLRLILNTSVFKNSRLGVEYELNFPHGNTTCLLHVPKIPIDQEKGIILSFTGFSMTGYKDSRIAVLNNAFVKLGFRVITPQIKLIDSLKIDPSEIDEISSVIKSITQNTTLNPNKFVPAVLAPSFTAGIVALSIASMPSNSVSSLCLIGAFCNFESTIEFALTNEENTDDYGMHILMKNFIHYEFGYQESLEKLIQTALEDNGLKRKVPLLPILLVQTENKTVALYKKLCLDTEFRKNSILNSWTKIPNFDLWKSSLDLSLHANKISCPVTLVHGKSDQVIPSNESLELYKILSKNNRHIHLELSELLDHGDLKIGLDIFKSITKLAIAFGHFLKFANQTR